MSSNKIFLTSILMMCVGGVVLPSCSNRSDSATVPESLSLEPSVLYMALDEKAALACRTIPEYTGAGSPVYESSDESVVTVSNAGVVTAMSPGKATITVAFADVTASCDVTVFTGKKPEFACVGDYYLSDGSILSRNSSPDEIRNADIIGIVFNTDPDRMGKAEKDFLESKGLSPNGLAMATRQAPTPLPWYFADEADFTLDEREIGIPDILVYGDPVATYELADDDLEGYMYCRQIKDLRSDRYEAGYYPLFSFAEEYGLSVPAPEISTGWYIPSNGQWFDIIRSLADADIQADRLVPEGDEEFFWMNLGTLSTKLNDLLSVLPENNRSEFLPDGMMFWTSSAASPSEARFVSLDDNGFVCCYRYYKMADMNALCILGF